MKKYLGLFLIMVLCITGCGQYNLENAVQDFTKKVETSKSYKLNGIMEISNGEEVFTYNLDTYFLKDDYYKVVLVNQTNNHEQIILKNKDGLYVVTPSLNKSFKFDSVWPNNSSQAYLLQNILNDIKNDNEKTFEKVDEGYIIKTKVNYPNNEELEYQKIYFDKDMNIQKVEVYNLEDIVKIKVTFKSVELRAKLKEEDFALDDLINAENEAQNDSTEADNCMSDDCSDKDTCKDDECSQKSSSLLDNIIYPLYIPTNTHLSNSEKVSTENGDRVILTFAGDKNFVIVEEAISSANEFEVIPVFGDPLMLNETIGALGANSVSWSDSKISYYLVSNNLSQSEMVNVAKSLTGIKSVMSTK